jgi:hypothetical protein
MEKNELFYQLYLNQLYPIINEISRANVMTDYVDKPYEYLRSTIKAIHKRLEKTVEQAEDRVKI